MTLKGSTETMQQSTEGLWMSSQEGFHVSRTAWVENARAKVTSVISGVKLKKTIEIIRPARLFFENVRGLLSDAAIIDVCGIIEGLGYQLSAPLLLGSNDCGNIHERKRVWIYATDPAQQPSYARGTETTQYKKQPASKSRDGNQQFSNARIRSFEQLLSESNVPEPVFYGMDDELPDRRQQLTAIGNGQDPIVMATAYKILSGEIA